MLISGVMPDHDSFRHGRRRPAIHVFAACRNERRGWPGHAPVMTVGSMRRYQRALVQGSRQARGRLRPSAPAPIPTGGRPGTRRRPPRDLSDSLRRNTGAGAAVGAHETPTGKLHRTNYIPAMPRQLPLPDAVVLPMGLRRIAASIASTYGDDGAVVITSGRDGIRIGVHNLEPSELRNILCVAIYHAVKKMRE